MRKIQGGGGLLIILDCPDCEERCVLGDGVSGSYGFILVVWVSWSWLLGVV